MSGQDRDPSSLSTSETMVLPKNSEVLHFEFLQKCAFTQWRDKKGCEESGYDHHGNWDLVEVLSVQNQVLPGSNKCTEYNFR